MIILEYLCPLCNSFVDVLKYCNRCGNIMKDCGMDADYYDDYSPYLGYNITNKEDKMPYYYCTHIFYCQNCNHLISINITKMFY